MYDSLTLWIISSINTSVLNSLSNVQECRNLVTNETVYRGFLNNLRVKVNGKGVSINGSLPKYYFDNNLKTFNRELTKIAIENLSDDLHLSLKEAIVFKIEVGTNFLMEKPVKTYLLPLGEGKYYERIEYRTGLLYKNKRRALEFYDKPADLRRHKENIPQEFLGKNLLRYELKLNQRIGSQLKQKPVVADMLYHEQFYSKLLHLWEAEYFSIDRINTINIKGIEPLHFQSVKHMDRLLAALGLNAFSLKAITNLLERFKNKITKTQWCRIKARLKELSNGKHLMEPDECLIELDSKVRQFVMEQQQ